MHRRHSHALGAFGRVPRDEFRRVAASLRPDRPIHAAVEPTARALAAARRAGMKVVYLKMEFEPDLSNAGGPDAPNRVRHMALGVGKTVEAPDGRESRVCEADVSSYS